MYRYLLCIWCTLYGLLYINTASAYSSVTGNDTTWRWYCNERLLPGETNPTIQGTGNAGTYQYKRVASVHSEVVGIFRITIIIPGTTVNSVTLNKTTLPLNVGDKEILTATVSPTNASNKAIIWSSSNEAIAKVSATGEVTAIAAGTAIITATTVEGGKTAACTATVTGSVVTVTGITLNKPSSTLTIGNKETLTATVSPENASNKSVTWLSSSTAIAKVSETGEVTAIATGTAIITATTVDGEKTAGCRMIVRASAIAVTGVTLDKTSSTLVIGDKEVLTATVSPTNASNKAVTWSSSNEAVAKVSASGEVTAIAAGTAIITATTVEGGKTATCTVTITLPVVTVTEVTLNKILSTLTIGDKETLIATVSPTNASNKAVTWSSSNEAVAKVSATGEVTAIAAGTAIITATTVEGGKTAIFTVIVKTTTGPNIGDYYYSDATYSSSLNTGKSCIGVIFWLDPANPGKGKIIAPIDTYTAGQAWSTEKIVTGATSDTDGAANTAKVRSLTTWSDGVYPAFAWCIATGGGWYLPARNELAELYNAKVSVNAALSSGGFITIDNSYYWSSTEADFQAAWLVLQGNNYTTKNGKGFLARVRAVRAF